MLEELEIRSLREFVGAIREAHQYDMSDFAQASLKHRIIQFSNQYEYNDVQELSVAIATQPSVFNTFLSEAAVVVDTEMFRDPAFWRALKVNVFPRLDEMKEIHIWVPGCSSGEELWTLLIALEEYGIRHKTLITASENRVLLEKAKAGRYDVSRMELSKSNYTRSEGQFNIDAYYQIEDTTAVMRQELASNVTWQDLKIDQCESPQTQFHLILFRNKFIYYNTILQEKVQDVLYEKLLKKGLLAIGIRESLIGSRNKDAYINLVPEEKIYRKI